MRVCDACVPFSLRITVKSLFRTFFSWAPFRFGCRSPSCCLAKHDAIACTLLRVLPQEAWFHGFLSYDEANEVLRCCPVGTFLIRFSQSSPTSLALAFVAPDKSVKQVKIDAVTGRGFVMDGA